MTQTEQSPDAGGREVEAKFAVPDAATFARLRAAESLGGLAVGELRTREVVDRYLDTADLRFVRRRLVCRIRVRGDKRIATLKGLDSDSATEGVYSRTEVETPAPADDPASWPEGEARRLALDVSGGALLRELFRLRQIRSVGMLNKDGHPVAELSLDEVYIGDDAPTYTLEAELQPGGDRAALDALVRDLRDTWRLTVQRQSKFEQAWAASGLPTPPADPAA